MPWVDSEICTGCGDCLEECPSGAIVLQKGKAFINMEDCIRCASCHELCPEEAVRHDGEKIPADVEANVKRTKECMAACISHLGEVEEGAKCLGRWIKHHERIIKIAEKTIMELESLNPDIS